MTICINMNIVINATVTAPTEFAMISAGLALVRWDGGWAEHHTLLEAARPLRKPTPTREPPLAERSLHTHRRGRHDECQPHLTNKNQFQTDPAN